MAKFAIAVHGGAGTILRSVITKEKEVEFKAALLTAVTTGEKILADGGSSLDAVEAAVRSMEDDPLFNAGKGSVFNHEGKHEMDACICYGKDLSAGAITGVRNVKNPIILARAVMEKTGHVFLSNQGAVQFAQEMNIKFEPDEYFFTQHRYDQWLSARETDHVILDHTAETIENIDKKFGTVGAVAMDVHGNLAAATSTGGMTNKRWGRIGDSPMIGAGTYANNKTCAISCTGHGEFFIRSVVAYDISCLMEYRGLSLKDACTIVVHDKLIKIGGEGGLVAVDGEGNIEMPFNSAGMYRAMKKDGESPLVMIYKD
ncbi:MAG: isoaspartyl peptidase/L-asparaginase [Bacteroidota bacterium]|nr:isoaspartyl peptidase/L-asparaginase [Bacteroidota bacterium]